MRVAFVVDIFAMHLDDLAADAARFRIPTNMIADFEFAWHAFHPDRPLGVTA
jgi:hypothetical protein